MKRSILRVVTVCLGVSLGATGCGDFLTGNDFVNNPNNPSNATLQQTFMAVQAGEFGWQESTLPLTTCMWMQQCTGIGGRFVEQYAQYTVTAASWSFDFSSVYTGGGLIDIRRVQPHRSGDAVELLAPFGRHHSVQALALIQHPGLGHASHHEDRVLRFVDVDFEDQLLRGIKDAFKRWRAPDISFGQNMDGAEKIDAPVGSIDFPNGRRRCDRIARRCRQEKQKRGSS